MDMLEGLLDGPRARGAFVLRAVLDPPWAIRIEDESPLCVLAIVRGSAWIWHDDGAPRRLAAGDVAIARGPDHYTMADDPSTLPGVVIYPGQRCTSTTDGRSLAEEWSLGVRTWGDNPDGEMAMLIGAYERAGELSRPLLSALPPLLTLEHSEGTHRWSRCWPTRSSGTAPGSAPCWIGCLTWCSSPRCGAGSPSSASRHRPGTGRRPHRRQGAPAAAAQPGLPVGRRQARCRGRCLPGDTGSTLH